MYPSQPGLLQVDEKRDKRAQLADSWQKRKRDAAREGGSTSAAQQPCQMALGCTGTYDVGFAHVEQTEETAVWSTVGVPG